MLPPLSKYKKHILSLLIIIALSVSASFITTKYSFSQAGAPVDHDPNDAASVPMTIPGFTQFGDRRSETAQCIFPTEEDFAAMIPYSRINLPDFPTACGLAEMYANVLWVSETTLQQRDFEFRDKVEAMLREVRDNVLNNATINALASADAALNSSQEQLAGIDDVESLIESDDSPVTSLNAKLAVNNQLLLMLNRQMTALIELQASQTKLLAAESSIRQPITSYKLDIESE